MNMTLLEITQDILNDMDSDEVNSITDTQEASMVAQIIKTTYFEMMTRRGADWAHLRKLGNLESVADNSRPTHLKLPERLSRIDYLNYDVRREAETRSRYQRMEYLYPDQFLTRANGLNTDNDNVIEVEGFDGIKFNVYNDRHPTHYTSFDDEYIVLNHYDVAVEDTVQGNKTQTQLFLLPSWTHTDAAVPDLPQMAFPALLAEAKSSASMKLRQLPDAKAEQQSARQQRMLSMDNFRTGGSVRYNNYGRRGGKMAGQYVSKLIDKESYSG